MIIGSLSSINKMQYPNNLGIFFLFFVLSCVSLNAQESIELEIALSSSGKFWIFLENSTKPIKIVQADRLEFIDNDLFLTQCGFAPGINEKESFNEKTERFSKDSVRAILFYPPVNPVTAKKYCRQLIQWNAECDQFFLINGDEIAGRLIRIQNRVLSLEIMGEIISLPLSKVRAICFVRLQKNNPDQEKGLNN